MTWYTLLLKLRLPLLLLPQVDGRCSQEACTCARPLLLCESRPCAIASCLTQGPQHELRVA